MFVREVLLEWDLVDLVDDAQLVTSELVGNVVRHARTDLILRIEWDDCVKISVRDWEPELGSVHPPDAVDLREHGRGLQIVDAVALDWGVDMRFDSKTVWLTLAVRSRVAL
jgi:anti-sigma regulatory factor (Ser/Thr protein kinase)